MSVDTVADQPRRKSLLANLAAVSMSRVGTSLLSFALYWWLSRRLSVSDLGAFAFAMGIFTVSQVIPLLGRQQPLIREVATYPERMAELVNAHWWFAWPLALALGLCLIGYGSLYAGALSAYVVLALALALAPTSWIIVAECALLGQERIRIIATVNFIEAVWRLLGGIAALWMGGALLAVMLVFLAGRCGVALIYLTVRGLPSPRVGAPPTLARWWALCRSTPVYFAIILLATFSSRFDVLALSYLVSLDELGRYSAGAKLYEALLMLPNLAALVMLPRMAKIFIDDRERFVRLLTPVTRAMLMLCIPVALVGLAVTPWGVGLLFSAQFSSAALVVQILIFGAALAVVDMVLSSVMIASNNQADDLRCLVLGLLTLVGGTFLLVPLVGSAGAAIAVTLHMLVKVAYRIDWATRSMGAGGLWLALAGTVAATVPALWVTWLLRGGAWPLTAMAAVGAYLAACALVGLLTLDDMRQARTLLRALLEKLLQKLRHWRQGRGGRA
jgi:O-antigen/teichoic acid export membrane protein